jgi:hypothetical protein
VHAPEEDTEGKSDPLYDDPGEEAVELQLIWRGIYLGEAGAAVVHEKI